jgi:multidrug transporter EmrE-like cation transporter
MREMMAYWIALMIAVVANIGANIAFKTFVDGFQGQLSFGTIGAALGSPWLWLGILSGVLIVAGFLYALQGIPLATAYIAATCLSIVGVAILGMTLFGEAVSLQGWVGIAVVLVGISLLVGSQNA